jgi:MGT family glycosyltransferase
MARIILNTFGSLGDLHPYLAIALELKRRGHQAVIATHGLYRERVEAMLLEFVPVRPNFDEWGDMTGVLRDAMDSRKGSRVVLMKLVLPWLRDSRDDLLQACRGADLLVDHVLTFSGPLVAEKLGIPRVSTTLQPMAMFSAHDPPVSPDLPWMAKLKVLGPWVWRGLWAVSRAVTRPLFRDVATLRAEMGLPATKRHPMLHGWSDELHLVLFSRELARPQPDWPKSAVQVGFPFHDRGDEGQGLPLSLEVFLRQGDPPLVFTLGSSAVYAAGNFYRAAAEAAHAMNRRAVLLVGEAGLNDVPGVPEIAHAPMGSRVVAVPYAPHSELMPRALATVHQGGVGTTGQAMRAGKPMLIVPFSHDQPDNAARCRALGIARILPRSQVSPAAFQHELAALLADGAIAGRARDVAARMKHEPGAAGAADAIEALLARKPGSSGPVARPAPVSWSASPS